MFRLIEFIGDYLLPHAGKKSVPARTESDHGLVVTGNALVENILDAIRLRRSVLVSGPRGCGKTFCVKQAIKRAYDAGDIGGWHFLQGNREIPRDYLSEDMLVINRDAQPQMLDALTIRPPTSHWARERASLMRSGQVPQEARGREPLQYSAWPAIPALTLHDLRRERQDDHWTPWSERRDWVVLFLDEINRFGDGFLDSLLSLTEEGIIVRGGDEYHVPVIVVATANPPGYDVTAKKLSPPLQARIGRSYRVSQPPLDHLVHVVLPSKAEMFEGVLGNAVILDERVKYLASAATLCLWGNPDAGARGAAFLTSGTRALLREAMRRNVVVRRAMSELSSLIQFGPDARAIGEWIGAAAAEAALARAARITETHLVSTAGPVLGHKLRESFNEGSEPEKVASLQRCIHDIVSTVLVQPTYTELFVLPYAAAAERLGFSERELLARLTTLRNETRWHPWLRALADLDVTEDVASFDAWRMRHASEKSMGDAAHVFASGGDFLTYEERSWFENVLLADPKVSAVSTTPPRRSHLLRHLGTQPLTNLETSLRHALEQKPYASLFTRQLIVVAHGNADFLKADALGAAQQAWVGTLDSLIDPHGGEVGPLLRQARAELSRTSRDDTRSVRVLVEALQVIRGDATDEESRVRLEQALELLPQSTEKLHRMEKQ